ncbi:hypothetical protein R3P38DRAFT_3620573 [Favolaschia claudopus]|uniref:Transcription activator GCR1-like domain-containing protein n=1 Tax=Favolaschia claudopus TaxID=2862362 RepID=A0AAW0DDY2_9AGAR
MGVGINGPNLECSLEGQIFVNNRTFGATCLRNDKSPKQEDENWEDDWMDCPITVVTNAECIEGAGGSGRDPGRERESKQRVQGTSFIKRSIPSARPPCLPCTNPAIPPSTARRRAHTTKKALTDSIFPLYYGSEIAAAEPHFGGVRREARNTATRSFGAPTNAPTTPPPVPVLLPALPTPPPTISRSLVYPTPASSSPPLPAILNPASHELPDTTSLSLEHFDFDFSYLNNTADTHPDPSPYPIFHPDQLSAIQSLQGLLPLPSHPSTPEPLPICTAATAVTLPAITQPHAASSVLSSAPKTILASHPTASTPPAHPLAVSSGPTTPISVAGESQASSEARVAAWQALVHRFGDARLRNHQWEWLTAGPKPNSYLPYYTYQPVPKITDIWTEWTIGLNGFLSTRELEETFSRPSWRRDVGSVKTERSRRKLVVDLVIKLSEKSNWNVDLALQFVRDRYELARDPSGKPLFKTVRAFCDFLGKKPKIAGEMTATEKILFESKNLEIQMLRSVSMRNRRETNRQTPLQLVNSDPITSSSDAYNIVGKKLLSSLFLLLGKTD